MGASKFSKIALATTLALFTTGAMAVPLGATFSGSGSDKLTIKGKLKKTNSCDVKLNKNGVFDIGTIEIKDKLKAAGGVFASKKFTATVKCEYPSAVILSFSSNRGADYPLAVNAFSRTRVNGATGPIVYKTRLKLEKNDTVTSPTDVSPSGLNIAYQAGLTPLAMQSSVGSLVQHGATNTFLNSNPSGKNAITFRDGVNFSMHKKYKVPFRVELNSAPFANWLNSMPSGKLNVKEQITIKSYII
jgi:hypothetical protein